MSVTIKIQSIEDAKNGIAIMEGITKENVVDIDHLTMGILEKGTKGGQTTVMFIINTPDGKHVFAQATGNEFRAMFAAFTGADELFNLNL